MRKEIILKKGFLIVLGLVLMGPVTADASILVPQTHFPGVFIDKYQDELPIFDSVRVDAASTPAQTIRYREFRQRILPDSFYVFSNTLAPFDGTLLWGYDIDDDGLDLIQGHSDPSRMMTAPGDILFPANTFIAERGVATTFTYHNELPRGIGLPDSANDQTNFLQRLLTIDQTLHFANPFEIDITNAEQTGNPFLGPQPVITHLHGAEVPSTVDGGPDQWFTPLQNPLDNASAMQGAGYFTEGAPASNSAIFTYPNDQEATTLWYHDHALGLTRINVYAGLAGYYFLRDSGTIDDGSGDPGKLPADAYELEFVIQDRMFDDTGELLFPDGLPFFIPQPPHLFWSPEFLGDTIVVNGKSWPFVSVDARRYRVRFLNGSNARFYNLYFKGKNSPTIWVIGTDGGLLNGPVQVSELLIAPGERYDTIIDFSNATNKTFTLSNNAKAPFPFGTNPSRNTIGQIAEFRVGAGAADNSFDPVGAGPNSLRLASIVELPGVEIPGSGDAAPVIDTDNVQRVRQLTLNENMGVFGPIEALLNNTKWSGRIDGNGDPIPVSVGNFNTLTLSNGKKSDGTPRSVTNWVHELPQVGSTEIWQIINLTGDAHPIHLHLVQFQILSRQEYNIKQYDAAYLRAFGVSNFFPKGQYKPAFGPPMPYNNVQGMYGPSADIPIIGGNPDVNGYLKGSASPPEPYERGWKDTVIARPKQVTTIVVRWTPQDLAFDAGADVGFNRYGFDPTVGPGYVWHCHIIDHEDNEMMRPYVVIGGGGPNDGADNLGDVTYPVIP